MLSPEKEYEDLLNQTIYLILMIYMRKYKIPQHFLSFFIYYDI